LVDVSEILMELCSFWHQIQIGYKNIVVFMCPSWWDVLPEDMQLMTCGQHPRWWMSAVQL